MKFVDVEYKEKPQLITSCGIKVLIPSKEDKNFINAMINSILTYTYNGDLNKMRKDYPLNTLRYDFIDDDYYVGKNMDERETDILVEYHNYIHYQYWEPREQEFYDERILVMMNPKYANLSDEEIDSKTRQRIEAKELITTMANKKQTQQPAANSYLDDYSMQQFAILNANVEWMRQAGYDPYYIQQYAASFNAQLAQYINNLRNAYQQSQIVYTNTPVAAYTPNCGSEDKPDPMSIDFSALMKHENTVSIPVIESGTMVFPNHPEAYHPNGYVMPQQAQPMYNNGFAYGYNPNPSYGGYNGCNGTSTLGMIYAASQQSGTGYPPNNQQISENASIEDKKNFLQNKLSEFTNQVRQNTAAAMEAHRNNPSYVPTFSPVSMNAPMGMNSMMGMGMGNYGGGYAPDDDSWMLATEEEIAAGKAHRVGTVIHGVAYGFDPTKEEEKPVEPRRTTNLVCTMVMRKNDKGETEYHYTGTEEAINKLVIAPIKEEEAAVRAASLPSDYKEEAVRRMNRSKMRTSDLIDWMAKYDLKLSKEIEYRFQFEYGADFLDFEAACIEKLEKFMANDPLAPVRTKQKDTLTKEDVETFLRQQQERLRLAEEEVKYQLSMGPSTMQSLKTMVKTVEENKNDSVALVKKLQSMYNLPIFESEAECQRHKEWMRQLEMNLNPLQRNSRISYKLWKAAMKNVSGSKPEDYDKDFDEWWNKPKKVNEEKLAKRTAADIREQYTAQRIQRLAYIDATSQMFIERDRQYLNEMMNKKFREFDKGLIPLNMSLNDFFNGEYGLGYLLHRSGVMKLNRYLNDVRRKYNPEEFEYNMRNNIYRTKYQPNIPYEQLTSSEAYNIKRQGFINSIFRHNHIGSITK